MTDAEPDAVKENSVPMSRELLSLTALEMREKFRSRELSPVEVARAALAQIERLNDGRLVAERVSYALADGRVLLGDVSLSFGRERTGVIGPNGSGKTTLIKLILGVFGTQSGIIYKVESTSVYIDQDYSLLDNGLRVYEQAQQFNSTALQEHEIKIRLNRFLFGQDDWDKSCSALSGGEKMRLMLCCLTIGNQAPDFIILDEPTNNLDIQNIEILTAAINEYNGTLIVVSHDELFLEQININKTIELY